ncbi:transcriptional attenuator, LytR family [Kytococcus aerolatus]|uniref:Transcriptional attenuator, LytR family n=1 Tax=Kytococcus aerolatus TaxID=592308 RepID=A0A212THR9_9MICO|nr:LCP family protein [Kytococcus aerolatus]SNC65589.1 transcriptional attenuator, LytR family [Kytococcus aerolatus]
MSTSIETTPHGASRGWSNGQRPPKTLGRAVGLTVLSGLVPGAGLLLTRAWRLGALALGALLLGGLVLLWRLQGSGLLNTAVGVATSRTQLWTIAIGLVLLTLLWLALIAFTARLARPAGLSTRGSAALTLVALLMSGLVLAPAAQALNLVAAHRKAVSTVFSEADTDGDEGGPAVGQEDPWADFDRVNLLMLGSDAADDRFGVRPDALMVMSIDPRTGHSVLIGIPRNLMNAPVPAGNPLHQLWPSGYDCGNECLINALWTEAAAHQELFGTQDNPGLVTTRDSIEGVVGLPIHHVVTVDLEGFEQLVDAMGGVEINVPERLPIGGKVENGQIVPGSIKGWIEPGTQHMDGYTALWYSRSRATTSDYDRMDRQRCMVGALVDQSSPLDLLRRYPAIAGALESNVWSDIPESDLRAWADLFLRIQDGRMKSLSLTNERIDTSDPDFAAIHRMVDRAINPPKPKKKPSTSTSSSESPSDEPTEQDVTEAEDMATTC